MFNIGILTDILDHKGGAEKYAVDVAVNIERQNYNPYVIATRKGGDLESNLQRAGIEYAVYERTGKINILKNLVKIRKYLLINDIKILHAHKSLYWAIALKFICPRLRVILHRHGGGFYRMNKLKKFVDRNLLYKYSCIMLFNSPSAKNMYSEATGINNDKLEVLPNVVDTEYFKPDQNLGQKLRKKYKLPQNAILIGQVSRLVSNKDHESLLDAFKIVSSKIKNTYLFIIGEGPLRDAIEAKIEHLGLKNRVIMTGHCENVLEYLCALDIGVHSSIFEGVPISLLEYMSVGLPAIATSVGGIPDVINDGKTGLLVPAKKSQKMADILLQLILNQKLRISIGEKSRQWVKEKASYQSLTSKITSIYDKVLKNS